MESAMPGRSLGGHGGVTHSDAACPRSSSTHISVLPAAPQDTALLTCASNKTHVQPCQRVRRSAASTAADLPWLVNVLLPDRADGAIALARAASSCPASCNSKRFLLGRMVSYPSRSQSSLARALLRATVPEQLSHSQQPLGSAHHSTRAPRCICGESRGSPGLPAADAAASSCHPVGQDPHASNSRISSEVGRYPLLCFLTALCRITSDTEWFSGSETCPSRPACKGVPGCWEVGRDDCWKSRPPQASFPWEIGVKGKNNPKLTNSY